MRLRRFQSATQTFPAIRRIVLCLLLVSSTSVNAVVATPGQGATLNPRPGPRISFAFDDGFTSAYTEAAPILSRYGFSATSFVVTNWVDKGTTANPTAKFMNWSQIATLRDTYHWEIGSHSVSHPDLSSVTPSQLVTEISKSKEILAEHGFDATSFALPFGRYSPEVKTQISKYYAALRGASDDVYNRWPYSNYQLASKFVQVGVSTESVELAINDAITNNEWLILSFHNISRTPSQDPLDLDLASDDLNAIAAYVKSKNVQVVNLSDGLVRGDPNLMPNSSFNQGLDGGWTTDDATAITPDSAANGSYPDPIYSLKLEVKRSSASVSSPRISVDSRSEYLFTSFVKIRTATIGSLSFRINEYDDKGKLVSSSLKESRTEAVVESVNFGYKPSSAIVKQASLIVKISTPSDFVAYLDNVQIFATDAISKPTLPPAMYDPKNLLPNGTFEKGIAQGWTTSDALQMDDDHSGKGSPTNPRDSIVAASGPADVSLDSPQVVIDRTRRYKLSAYINIVQSSERRVGLTIDEYDAGGKTISVQTIPGVIATGVTRMSFEYTATNAQVKKARMSITVPKDSVMIVYIDDVQWLVSVPVRDARLHDR